MAAGVGDLKKDSHRHLAGLKQRLGESDELQGDLQLGRVRTRLQENHRAQFSYDEALVTEIANRCTEVESGARNVDHILTRTLLPEISREFLARMAVGETISSVHISVDPEGNFQYQIS